MPIDPHKKSTRRQFLKGRSTLDAIRDALPSSSQVAFDNAQMQYLTESAAIHPESANAQRKQASHIVHLSKNAMGCQFQFLFNAAQHGIATDVAIDAFEVIEQLEAEMSIYRDDSAVSILNRAPPGTAVKLSEKLFECFEIAIAVSSLTTGAFDISSGPLSKLWGFENRAPGIPDESDVQEALKSVGFEHICLDQAKHTVVLLKPNMKINFGGIGKGFAIDVCTELFLNKGIDDFVIHGGQSSVAARGSRAQFHSGDSLSPPAKGWTIGLSDPQNSATRLCEIRLCNRFLGTSGSSRQAFFHQGKKLAHIIDPRTGKAGTDVLSATVLASSAAVSDALATAFCVMPFHQIEAFCKVNSDISAAVTYRTRDNKSAVETSFMNFDQIETVFPES